MLKVLAISSITVVMITLSACQGQSTPLPDDNDEPSVARQWNELILSAIRRDFARPTVHARNLFHTSAAMYDSWAAYQQEADTYLLGKTLNNYACQADISAPTSLADDSQQQRAQEATLSVAAFELIKHRFQQSPGRENIILDAERLLASMDYTNPSDNDALKLGENIARCYIEYGQQDGSNEINGYANTVYTPVNPPLAPTLPGNPDIELLNRWQPLALEVFLDQAGNPIVGGALEFLSPEWGDVLPFSLSPADRTLHQREGVEYSIYHDPGAPPLAESEAADYQWGFSLVAKWSSHLDPSDGVMIDISPASLGNLGPMPETLDEYQTFYDGEGGDNSQGHPLNPVTNRPYTPQIVPRADYARVLAEFWADGPDSETPPGHWFVILNEVNDAPLMERRFAGKGPPLEPLEWDVKAYFTLGGAMHDAAISAWGAKGWYDYIRPISAIRAMADLGQSSDPQQARFHENGIPLDPGFIEIVQAEDVLAGYEGQNLGKIKVRAWQGPDFVVNPATDTGDVGWILAENWWPYQRPSFVTPPFAGYVSGHSTFSRAAAEVLTALTGDPFFPGGKSEFNIAANDFLVFEQGPSVNITLEWATYRDAADQCSLSRIWGGIHPPADDIPGRKMGENIGKQASSFAEKYF